MSATTRSDFMAYFLRDFKRTDKSTEALDWLRDTIVDIAGRHKFQDFEKQSYLALVTAQEDYALPSNADHLNHPIRLLQGLANADEGWPLRQITKEEYDEVEGNPNRTSPPSGTPWGYTIYSKEILLTPPPDSQGWYLEINWTQTPTVPSADGDAAHPWETRWDETIKWGMLARGFESMDMDQLADKYSRLFEAGRQVSAGRSGAPGLIGGVANMIQEDIDRKEAVLIVRPKNF